MVQIVKLAGADGDIAHRVQHRLVVLFDQDVAGGAHRLQISVQTTAVEDWQIQPGQQVDLLERGLKQIPDAQGVISPERFDIKMRIEGRFRRIDLAQGGSHVAAQRLQVRTAGQQLERERRWQRLLERRQRHRMDGRHALRIGADQRPQGFTILGQHPLGANDLLAGGELLSPGIGHIHTVFHAALGPVLMGRCRELGNTLQLLQQRDFLERRLHGEIELRHAAGDVEFNAGGFRQPGIFLANGGGDPGAIGSPEIDIQLRPDANGIQRIPGTVLIHRQGVRVGPAKGFVGDPQAVLRRDGGGLQAHRRPGEFHRGLRLGDA